MKEKKAAKIETYFEFNGVQISSEEMVKKVVAAYIEAGNEESSLESLKVYINANERRAYYIVNDKPENNFIEY